MNTRTLVIMVLIAALVGGAFLFLAAPENQENAGDTNNEEKVTGTPENETTGTSKPTDTGSDPSSTGSPQKPPATPSSSPSPSTTQQTGKIFFTITDDSVPLDAISSLSIAITNISARKSNSQWVAISNARHVYDLLQLKRDGKLELVRELLIPADTYDLLSLTIESVVLTKNGIAQIAKLPSKIVYLPFSLPLRPGQTAAISLDVLADKSLHVSTAGEHIFAPVIRVDVLGEIQHTQKSGSKIEFFGGLPKFASSYGMDEIGVMRKNSLGIDSLSHIEITRDIFVLIPQTLNRSLFTVAPADAMDTALQGGYIVHVQAVYAVMLDKKPMWRVQGITSTGSIASVYINAETGSIQKVE